MAQVFLSHSTHDRDFLERELITPLASHGVELWYSKDSIEGSAQWERSILNGLKGSDWFLLAMSPHSARSHWVKLELDWAFQRKRDRIIPILLANCEPDDFHIGMVGLQHIDFRSDPREARYKLLRVIKPGDSSSRQPDVSPTAPDIRRFPFYFILDCSLAMAGEPLEAVRMGLRSLVADLQSNPQFLEYAWVSVITFGSHARQIAPLAELMEFQVPDLQADSVPGVDVGGAIRCLLDAMARERVPMTSVRKGDYKPLSVLIVGQPSTTPLAPCAQMLQAARNWVQPPLIIVAGPEADPEQLKLLSDNVIQMQNLSPQTLATMLKWVSPAIME